MIFLKLNAADQQRLFDLARDKKGPTVERLARRAFAIGLQYMEEKRPHTHTQLVRQDSSATPDSSVEAQDDGSAAISLGRFRNERKTLAEIDAYILAHHAQQKDSEMGNVLGCGRFVISRRRRKLGLLYKRGAPSKGASQQMSTSIDFATLDELIRTHWQSTGDADIGRMMDPHVTRINVQKRRYSLGLRKAVGSSVSGRENRSIRESIDPVEFERMVIREGYTMTDYIAFKKLSCSRERLRQVVEELDLKHSRSDRKPEWILYRSARKLGNMNLVNRDWLMDKMEGVHSMATLAAELGIADADLFIFIRGLKITHPSLRKKGVETVTLKCAHCGKSFVRLKRWVDRREKMYGDNHRGYYCSQSCVGKHNARLSRERRDEKVVSKVENEKPE